MPERTLTLKILGDERDGGRAMKKAADNLDKVADSADKMGRSFSRSSSAQGSALAQLEKRLDDARAKVRQVAEEFARTGDEELFKTFKADTRTVAKLERIHRAINDIPRQVETRVDVDVDRPSLALRTLGRVAGGLMSSLPVLGSVFDSVMRVGSAGAANAATAATNLSTNIANLILAAAAAGAAIAAGMAAAGAAIGALIGTVYALGGALASLPALGVGAAGGLATLALGVHGLAGNYKELTKATGGAGKAAEDLTGKQRAVEAAARGVTRAEREVAEAQRDARQATLDLTRARAEEAERISDLGRELASARLDEESAVLSVAEAELELRNARAYGSMLDIERAQLAYREAQQRVLEVKDRVEDLGAEQKKTAKVGVDGSDAVQAALERQRQSQLRVVDAQERQIEATQRLADAQRELAKPPAGGGGGAAKELVKLAPAAQQFLNVILGLRPAFERLRLGVQQRLFVGLAAPVRELAAKWFPALETSLGRMADTGNRLAKAFIKTISDPQFIKNIQAGMEATRRLVERVGMAVAGPLTKAFGTLAGAAGPFLDALGDELARVVEDFAKWIDTANRSGKLQTFMQKAAEYMRDLFEIGRDVGRIIGGLAKALFGQRSGAETGWDAIVDVFDRLGDWFQDPKNQERIEKFARDLVTASVGLYATALTIGGWIDKVDGWVTKVEKFATIVKTAFGIINIAAKGTVGLVIGQFTGGLAFLASLPGRISGIARRLFTSIPSAAGSAVRTVGGWMDNIVRSVSGLGGRIARAASGMWSGISSAFRSAINTVISMWNRLYFDLPSINWGPLRLGGGRINVPSVPYMAKGGDVRSAGIAMVGERGPEVVHLPEGARVSPLSGGAAGQQLLVNVRTGGSTLDQLFAQWFHEGVRKGQIQLSVRGGKVAVGHG